EGATPLHVPGDVATLLTNSTPTAPFACALMAFWAMVQVPRSMSAIFPFTAAALTNGVSHPSLAVPGPSFTTTTCAVGPPARGGGAGGERGAKAGFGADVGRAQRPARDHPGARSELRARGNGDLRSVPHQVPRVNRRGHAFRRGHLVPVLAGHIVHQEAIEDRG